MVTLKGEDPIVALEMVVKPGIVLTPAVIVYLFGFPVAVKFRLKLLLP